MSLSNKRKVVIVPERLAQNRLTDVLLEGVLGGLSGQLVVGRLACVLPRGTGRQGGVPRGVALPIP